MSGNLPSDSRADPILDDWFIYIQLNFRVRCCPGRKLLETGVYATVDEMAAAERINSSYVCRVLRLTLLAPDIVEVIFDGRQPAEVTLAALMRRFAVEWGERLRSSCE